MIEFWLPVLLALTPNPTTRVDYNWSTGQVESVTWREQSGIERVVFVSGPMPAPVKRKDKP